MTEEIRIALEEENKKQKIKDILLDQISKAIKEGAGEDLKKGRHVYINFDITNIPEELRDVFKEKLPILWGEISDNISTPERRHFCVLRKIEIEGTEVKMVVLKNW